MRILHVIPTYVPAWRHGGPVFAVHGLAKALLAAGHEVEVFTTNLHGDGVLDVPADRRVEAEGVPVTYFSVAAPRRLHRAPRMAAALAARVREFDVVHLHSLFLWPTFAAARAAERAGVPYLVAPRGMLVQSLFQRRGGLRKSVWLRCFERRTLERAAALHATAELEAHEARQFGFRLPPIHVVPNGVDAAALAVPPDTAHGGAEPRNAIVAAAAGKPYLLFLGRVSWKKGLDRLIAALPRVPTARLVVAGNDEEGLVPRLCELADRHDVAERVEFVGAVDGVDKALLLREASLFVLPSYSENFGNAALEAMAVGLPVVVTPEVGLATVIAESGAGLVVPGTPAATLGGEIAELLADPARRAEMGRRGAATAEELFGWNVVARQMEAVYRRILAPGSRST